MSLINDLAEIRALQGKEPLPSPHIIAGFEPGAPAVPDFVAFGEVDSPGGQVADEFGLDDIPPAPAPVAPASPLIPRRAPVPVAPAPAVTHSLGSLFALAVGDRLASWKGRDVMLSESEEKAIRAIVLKAIQREILADLALAGVKRTRRPKVTQEAEAPKKRGRPRKVQP